MIPNCNLQEIVFAFLPTFSVTVIQLQPADLKVFNVKSMILVCSIITVFFSSKQIILVDLTKIMSTVFSSQKNRVLANSHHQQFSVKISRQNSNNQPDKHYLSSFYGKPALIYHRDNRILHCSLVLRPHLLQQKICHIFPMQGDDAEITHKF